MARPSAQAIWRTLWPALWPALCLALCLLPVAASAEETPGGAQARDAGPATRPVPVAASPGKGFGLEVTPPGSPVGAPVVLEARLSRPGDPSDAPPLRWLVAAATGQPATVAWEFAYDWEIVPGVWVLRVYSQDVEIASATFDVSKAPDSDQPGQGATPKDMVKASGAPPAAQPAGATDTIKAPPMVPADGVAAPPSHAVGRPRGEASDRQDAAGPSPSSSMPAKTDVPGRHSPTEPSEPKQPRPDLSRQEASFPAAAPQASPRQGVASAREAKPAQDSPPKPVQDRTPKPAATGADLPPGRTLHVLVGGVYSEEAKALWVAALLREQGVKACVRREPGGRRLWAVITGWRESAPEARELKARQTPVVGDIVVRAMASEDLGHGLRCP